MKRLLLFLPLFGVIAPAMEPVIIDVTGAKFALTQAQRNALGQCKTLKHMLADCGSSQLIDFEGFSAPVIKGDLEQLAAIIEEPKKIDYVPDAQIIQLFKTADYLHAPKKVSELIVEKAEHIVDTRVAELNVLPAWDDAQASEATDLQMVRQSLEKYKLTLTDLLKKIEKKYPKEIEEWQLGYVNLNYEFTRKLSKKKLSSLKGIEHLKELIKNRKIDALKVKGHKIKEINICFLSKIFPGLDELSLRNNQIEHINETEALRGLQINLCGNPLKSITIAKPEQCNYIAFRTDKPDLKIDFPQDSYSRRLAWFKSLAAKSKAILRYVLPSRIRLGCYAGLGTLYELLENQELDRLRLDLKINPKQLAFVIGRTIFPLREERSKEETEFLYEMAREVSQRFARRGVIGQILENQGSPIQSEGIVLSQAVHIEPKMMPLTQVFSELQIPTTDTRGTFSKWFLSPSVTALKTFLFCAAIEAGYHALMSICGQHDYSITDYLARKKQKNPYRIRIYSDNAVIKGDFPSNYAYNLFGKN